MLRNLALSDLRGDARSVVTVVPHELATVTEEDEEQEKEVEAGQSRAWSARSGVGAAGTALSGLCSCESESVCEGQRASVERWGLADLVVGCGSQLGTAKLH